MTTTESDLSRQNTETQRRALKRHLITRVCEATPCAIEVPRRTKLVAKIELDGYEPAEIFVKSGRKRGGAAGSVAANTSISAGSGALVGAWAASMGNAFSQIFSLGALPAPYSTSAFASGGAAIGLGIGAGFIATDMATGANLNLYPNPIVLGLVPEGSPALIDPLALPFREKMEAEVAVSKYCRKVSRKNRDAYKPKCEDAKTSLAEAKSTFESLETQLEDALKDKMRPTQAN